MAVLQVFQAKLLRSMDESGPDPEAFKDLHSTTDLALRATKTTAQAIGRSMANLTVLERHLWLNLTEMKDVERAAFLDSPISTTGLFGPAVKGFAECFTEAQKALQAMRHFLPKRNSSASDRHKKAPLPQPAKPVSQLRPAVEACHRSRSKRRHQFPSSQSARDPNPRLCWTPSLGSLPSTVTGRKREWLSPAAAGPPSKKPFTHLPVPSLVQAAGDANITVNESKHAHLQTTAVLKATQIKHKKSTFLSVLPPARAGGVLNVGCEPTIKYAPLHISTVPTVSQAQNSWAAGSLSQSGPSSDFLQPLAMRAKAWKALPGISEWVLPIATAALPFKNVASIFSRKGVFP
ncbi:hypothetical protein PO909_015190 [Leuciscus waleckii]